MARGRVGGLGVLPGLLWVAHGGSFVPEGGTRWRLWPGVVARRTLGVPVPAVPWVTKGFAHPG